MSECTKPYQDCGYKTHYGYSDPRGTNSITHTRDVDVSLTIGGVTIVGHQEQRMFRLDTATTPPHSYQIPDFFIVNGRLAYQTEEPSQWLDVNNCGWRDGIFGMVQVLPIACVTEPVTTVPPVLSTSVTDYYRVTDSYIITMDLDAGCCLYRKDTCTMQASGSSGKGIGYLSQLSYGTTSLEARNAVRFNPAVTLHRELRAVVDGKDFLLASKDETFNLYTEGFLLVYPGYYLDTLLHNPLSDEEQYDYDHVNYGGGWKPVISLDWKFDDHQNYYFKADPVMNPGDKESLDGSFKHAGDYFFPKWIKRVLGYGFRWFYSAAAAARVQMDPSFRVDDLGTEIPTSDSDLSYSATTVPAQGWMDTSGSTGQIVWNAERKEAVFSVVDARMDITVNGRYAKGELHMDLPVEDNVTLFPISYGEMTNA